MPVNGKGGKVVEKMFFGENSTNSLRFALKGVVSAGKALTVSKI